MNYMSDLISRQAVEQAIKEFNKKRVDKVPNTLDMEEHSKMMDTLLEENVEMLKIIRDIPNAYNEVPDATTESVKGKHLECEVPSDCFNEIQEVRVIDEWTEEERIFKEVGECELSGKVMYDDLACLAPSDDYFRKFKSVKVINEWTGEERFFKEYVPEINVGNINYWIPVSERLPEESLESVIGWDYYRERCVFVQYYGGRWRLPNIESVIITAWQPMPQAYKEKECKCGQKLDWSEVDE